MIATSDDLKKKRRERTEDSRKKANTVRAEQGYPRMKAALGVVLDGESFTSEAFCDRLGITRSQLTEMRKLAEEIGVILARKVGGRVRFLGSDYLSFLKNCPEAKLK